MHPENSITPSAQNSFATQPPAGPRLPGSFSRIPSPSHSPGCATTVTLYPLCAWARHWKNAGEIYGQSNSPVEPYCGNGATLEQSYHR
jgi:hypothetical protein